MAQERIASADVLEARTTEQIVGIIREKSELVPEFAHISASPVAKTYYKTLVRTALPVTGFRAINSGRETRKSTRVARAVELAIFDAGFDVDLAAAMGFEWGQDALLAMEAADHIESAMLAVARQLYYGVDEDATGFAGIDSICANSDDDLVVDATGTTQTGASSVFAIKTGLQYVQFAWGNNGQITDSTPTKGRVYDGDGKWYDAWLVSILGWVGVQLVNHNAVGRICNLTTQTGKGLTDSLLFQLIEKFRTAGQGRPDMFFAHPRDIERLRASRTSFNQSGAPVATPAEIEGIPIYPSTAIRTTETLLTALGT